MITLTRGAKTLICTLITASVIVFIGGGILLSRAKERATQILATSRLSQMKLALAMYESKQGTLPPLSLKDNQGNPILSWRALILPQLSHGEELFHRLDLSQPWNSSENLKAIDGVSRVPWDLFARTRAPTNLPVKAHILAYVGTKSVWDSDTGLPKGKTTDYPGAILLVSIPDSPLHPLQPGDITEQQVRERVNLGQAVLFIATGPGHRYGIVTIEQGELAFHTWQEELDQRERH